MDSAMKDKTTLRWWLKAAHSVAANSQDAAYFRLGHKFSSVPLDAKERHELGQMLANIRAFRVGECYRNAGEIALEQEKLIFCEGVAAGNLPVTLSHAWVSYKGRAIDVTWPTSLERKSGYRPSMAAEQIMKRVVHNLKTSEYWGIEIPRSIISKHFFKYERWSPMFDPAYARLWPKFETQIFGETNGKALSLMAG